MLSSAGASILAVGYALPLFYLGWSLVKGKRAPRQSLEGDRPRMGDCRRRRRRTISRRTPRSSVPPYQYDRGEPLAQAGDD